MKKFLLLLSLFCAATAAHADWTRLEHADKTLALYADTDTRKDSGNGTVLIWHLVDYQSAQDFEGKSFRSIKGQNEYDCTKGVSRELMHLWHRDSMGNSQLVQATYVPTAWLPPEAGSITQTLMQVACGKK